MEQGSSSNRKKKVMVAIDDSELSQHALQWTLQNLALSITDSELLIYTVQLLADYNYLYEFSFDSDTTGVMPDIDNDFYSKQEAMELVKNIEEKQKKAVLQLLEKSIYICKTFGMVAEGMTEIGNPKEAICRAVEKYNIQLLVVGSHGRGAFKSTFLGSVSNYCVHHAECPVLVVRKEEN